MFNEHDSFPIRGIWTTKHFHTILHPSVLDLAWFFSGNLLIPVWNHTPLPNSGWGVTQGSHPTNKGNPWFKAFFRPTSWPRSGFLKVVNLVRGIFPKCFQTIHWAVVLDILYVHPYLGKNPILTNMFKWVETTNQIQVYDTPKFQSEFTPEKWWVEGRTNLSLLFWEWSILFGRTESTSRTVGNLPRTFITSLGGGFKYVLFSPLFGEDFQFD